MQKLNYAMYREERHTELALANLYILHMRGLCSARGIYTCVAAAQTHSYLLPKLMSALLAS
jgi:hypothetical protein